MQSRLGVLPIIHIALGIGLAMSLGVFYFVRTQDGAPVPAEDLIQMYLIVGIAAAASSAVMAFILPGILLAKARAKETGVEPLTYEHFKKLLAPYQSAKIVQWALVEGPGLLNGVFFFRTGHLPFLIIGGVSLGFLLFCALPCRTS